MKAASALLAAALVPFLSAHAQNSSTSARAAAPVTLGSLRDANRVLLVFDNGNNALAEQQLNVAAQHIQDFQDRQLLLVGLTGSNATVPTAMLTPADDIAARKRYHIAPGQFTVLLLGKDGGEKLRSNQPIGWSRLQTVIDAMPMRQEEHTRTGR